MTLVRYTWADRDSDWLKNYYRRKGRYVSARDHDSPFFIIVHLKELDGQFWREYFPETVARTLREIQGIKSKFPHLDYDLWPPEEIYPETPKDRTILVCGCFDRDCVEKQRRALIRSGRKAHISDEGTPALFLIDQD